MATISGTGGADLQNDTIGTSDTYNMGGGNDTVFGGGGADIINGDAGNDLLNGGGGTDNVSGGDGDDTLVGGNNDDSLFGGAGVDTADYSGGGTSVNVNLSGLVDTAIGTGGGGANNIDDDTLVGIENVTGTGFADTIIGDIGNNVLSGLAGNDTINGGSGSDTLLGGAGADTLAGGVGSDTADYSSSASAVNVNILDALAESSGDAAGDVLTSIENITGSAGNDTLTGNNNANEIVGGDGADVITGNLGSDSIDGGAGNDTINAGPDTIGGGAASPTNEFLDWTTGGANGSDIANSFTQDTGTMSVNVNFVAGVANAYEVDTDAIFSPEALIGNNSSAYLERPGSGETTELSVNFSAEAGSGMTNEVLNVQFRISDIDVTSDGGGFIDNVTILAYDELGNLVPVTITTTSTAINIAGNTATGTGIVNTTPASAQGSILISIPGPVSQIVVQYNDLGNARQAINVSDIHFTTIPATADTSDADTVSGGLGDDLIEAGLGADLLSGDDGNDSLLGEAGNDLLSGGIGSDSLVGGDGDDSLDGGAGADTLMGGIGNDSMFGGADNDVMSGDSGNDGMFGGDGADSISGGAGNDTINFGAGDDSVFGGDGNDLIDDIGGIQLAGANRVEGGAGNDTIYTGEGSDSVYGDAGVDFLLGENGNDQLFGGADNDDLSGGTGNDSLYGGTGADTISGGDDRDTVAMVFGDASGSEFVDGGSGAGTSSDNDTLTVDLAGIGGGGPGAGWTRIDIVYDPLNGENGTITFFGPGPTFTVIGTLTFTDIENLVVVCFTPGTMILTERGEVAVEALSAGDMVLTRDNGLQPLRWIGQRALTLVDLMVNPELQPVRIGRESLGDGGPTRDMLVSPQHRVLLEGARAEMLFGEAEVLVAAKHLLGTVGVSRALPGEGVTYIHLLFDRHEIVCSDGIWTESFQPAGRTLSSLDAAARDEVLVLFPNLAVDNDNFAAARLSLKAHEAKVLLSV